MNVVNKVPKEDAQFIHPWRINSWNSRGQNPDNLSTKSLTCYMRINCILEFAMAKEVLFKSQNHLLPSPCIANYLSYFFQNCELWTYGIVSDIIKNWDWHVSTKNFFSVRRHFRCYMHSLKIILNVHRIFSLYMGILKRWLYAFKQYSLY